MPQRMGRSRWLQFALGILGGLSLITIGAAAQTGTATIVGTVTDPNDDPVPSAKLTIKNIDTDHEFTIASDAGGAYRARGLLPGNYELRVAAVGFALEVHKGVTLTVAQTVQINISLTIGTMTQQVVVEGAAPFRNLVTWSPERSVTLIRQAMASICLSSAIS